MATKKKAATETTQPTTSAYQIVDNVPMPERAPRGRAGRFPFDALQPKQAFIVTLADEGLTDLAKLQARVRSSIYSAGKRLGVKFISQADPKAGTVTVWRTSPKA
jgi:hypothetical protein